MHRENLLAEQKQTGNYMGQEAVQHHQDLPVEEPQKLIGLEKRVVTLESLFNKALPGIGTYGALDNTQQVVAVIDEVSTGSSPRCGLDI